MSRVGKGRRGFSLLELLVVLSLIGVAAVIALPSLENGIRKRQVRQSVLSLAAVARDLRRRAIDQGTLKQLVLSPREDSYLASDAEIVRLPEAVKITGVAGGAPMGKRLTQFVFFPNGSILGGAIELSDRKGATYLIRFEPLVGRVVVTQQ